MATLEATRFRQEEGCSHEVPPTHPRGTIPDCRVLEDRNEPVCDRARTGATPEHGEPRAQAQQDPLRRRLPAAEGSEVRPWSVAAKPTQEALQRPGHGAGGELFEGE